ARDAVIAGRGLRGGPVAEPPQAQHRLPEAGQRPAAPRGAAPPPLVRQQAGNEAHQFPRNVNRGTIGDHVEPSSESDLVVRPLLLGLHAHLRAVRFVRVSAQTPQPGHDKARLSEPNSLRSPHCLDIPAGTVVATALPRSARMPPPGRELSFPSYLTSSILSYTGNR